mgnify:CR=1 FL=1
MIFTMIFIYAEKKLQIFIMLVVAIQTLILAIHLFINLYSNLHDAHDLTLNDPSLLSKTNLL